ncbi:MAG TPA: hypothetical protein VMH81_21185 [Bryobacteraceae bacterium]|nr:hypothetical protein [Bryobacteraceae bacterium]
MTLANLAKTAVAGTTLAFVGLMGMLIGSPRSRADNNDNDSDDAKVQEGLAISPVPLNLAGKDRDLVGLGSYIVNAQAICNDCHALFPPPPTGVSAEYTPTGNPYLLLAPAGPFSGRIQVNPATYLGGGNDFGPFGPGIDIVSRNLTPDRTGQPEGGHSLSDFMTIMRTGADLDHLHPTCSASRTTNCLPAPLNGNVLQVMPWPIFRNMSDHELQAIYEFLSAIPCIDTVVPGQPQLRNQCH